MFKMIARYYLMSAERYQRGNNNSDRFVKLLLGLMARILLSLFKLRGGTRQTCSCVFFFFFLRFPLIEKHTKITIA